MTAVIQERIHRFLKHALLVADDDLGRAQVNELLQTVIAVDNTAIKIVKI